MHDRFRRKLEMLARVRDFGVTHASLFPSGSGGAELFSALTELLTELQNVAGTQALSLTAGRSSTESRADARKALRESMKSISITAKALSLRFPELKGMFPSLHSCSDQVLLATARAFAREALPFKDRFIALDTPANFIEELEARIASFEKALTGRRNARRSQIEATASMEEMLERGINLVEQLKAVVHRRLEGSEALMAAWLRVSRVTSRNSKPDDASSPTDSGTEKETGSGETPATHSQAGTTTSPTARATEPAEPTSG